VFVIRNMNKTRWEYLQSALIVACELSGVSRLRETRTRERQAPHLN